MLAILGHYTIQVSGFEVIFFTCSLFLEFEASVPLFSFDWNENF